MLKPPKPIKRAQPRAESDADRATLAVITDAEVLQARQLVANMKERGSYTEHGVIRWIGAADARQYWGV